MSGQGVRRRESQRPRQMRPLISNRERWTLCHGKERPAGAGGAGYDLLKGEGVGSGNEETGSTAESACRLQESLLRLFVQTRPFYL